MGKELFAIETFQIDTYTENNIYIYKKRQTATKLKLKILLWSICKFTNLLWLWHYVQEAGCSLIRIWLQPAALAAAFSPKWDVLMNPYSESLCMLT